MLKWDGAPKDYQEPTQLDACKEWLEDLLKENRQGLKPKDVAKIGVEQGFSERTIYRARNELHQQIANTHGRQSPENTWKWVDEAAEE